MRGKQKKDKKKKKSGKKGKRKSNRDRRQSRADSEGFFSPTSLPSAPSGLTGSETMTVESTDDGHKVVTFITWAEEQATTSSQD